jgi:hypothetical protein
MKALQNRFNVMLSSRWIVISPSGDARRVVLLIRLVVQTNYYRNFLAKIINALPLGPRPMWTDMEFQTPFQIKITPEAIHS